MQEDYFHEPVMVEEVLEYLNPVPGNIVVDNTIGGGGHAKAIIEKILPGGRLVGLDVDDVAVNAASANLKEFGDAVKVLRANFKDAARVLKEIGITSIDRAFYDLGVSSQQIADSSRGFSYTQAGPLDMRFDRNLAVSAFEVVNHASEEALADIMLRFGQEKWAKVIARRIVQQREVKPIETTTELAEIVRSCVPRGERRGDPSKRVFQAIRIYVNDELSCLEKSLFDEFELLADHGRIVVLSYHSLEDSLVKRSFARMAGGCICPSWYPRCVCGRRSQANVLTKGAVLPSREEVLRNKRAKSARLRAIEKIVN